MFYQSSCNDVLTINKKTKEWALIQTAALVNEIKALICELSTSKILYILLISFIAKKFKTGSPTRTPWVDPLPRMSP